MIKTKKLLCGFELTVLGQGTWGTGGRDTADPNADDEKLAAVIRHGVSLGFTRIDTAEMYAAGHSEELVGKAIAGLDRGSLFITSKVWKTHLHADDVLQAAENSLKRLKTDYMDLFLIHQVNPDVPLEDTMRGMDAVVKHGFARAIGVSNFSLQRFQKAQACTSNKLVLNQVHYNLVVRECEPQLLPWCQANDVMLEAWRPLRNLTPCPLMDEMRENTTRRPRRSRSPSCCSRRMSSRSRPCAPSNTCRKILRRCNSLLKKKIWNVSAANFQASSPSRRQYRFNHRLFTIT